MLRYILFAIAITFTATVFAQQETVSLLINGRKVDERRITEDPSVINIEKIKLKRISSAVMVIKGAANSAFKRTIQVTDETENPLFQVNEQTSKHQFKIDLAKLRRQISKLNIVKVFLAEDPANEMMKVRSSKRLIAEVHFK